MNPNSNGNTNNPEEKEKIEQAADKPLSPPRCPHCNSSPPKMSAEMTLFGQLQAVIFACGYEGCRKIVSVAPFGMLQPQVVQPPPGLDLSKIRGPRQ